MTNEMRKLKVIDPVAPQASVCGADMGGEGLSPMDPPDAYSPPAKDQVAVEEMHPFLQSLVEDHNELKKQLNEFEECLASLQRERGLSRDVNHRLKAFLEFFDKEFVAHSRREEVELFPLLKTRLLEKGEHSPTEVPLTGVDVLENEHVLAIKGIATVLALLSLIPMLSDNASREIALDLAIARGGELVELLNLHVFREDHVAFSLAHTLLTPAELDAMVRPVPA